MDKLDNQSLCFEIAKLLYPNAIFVFPESSGGVCIELETSKLYKNYLKWEDLMPLVIKHKLQFSTYKHIVNSEHKDIYELAGDGSVYSEDDVAKAYASCLLRVLQKES